MKTKTLVDYLDNLLKINNVEDDSLNGLQVENLGEVKRIAVAVDASFEAIKKTRDLGAHFLIVHHGLFWGKPVPLSGFLYRRIRLLIESDIALYAAHLPLDLHPTLGNNAQICKVMGWPIVRDFGEYHGSIIGKEVSFAEPVPFIELVDQFRQRFHCEPTLWDFGPEKIGRLGCVSGGAIAFLDQAIRLHFDAFITGEPKHECYWTAKEAGINVIFGGHYITETLGVKAVGEMLQKEFELETVFIDLPTGF
ncbi:Nif3-like dinuclear metal center hexameric protein [bacterium]|nr:Nif3-like dinuclear metal center hexameric protein [bacterium]